MLRPKQIGGMACGQGATLVKFIVGPIDKWWLSNSWDKKRRSWAWWISVLHRAIRRVLGFVLRLCAGVWQLREQPSSDRSSWHYRGNNGCCRPHSQRHFLPSGNKNSPTFAQNMELLRLLLQTHTPVILSSAIPIGRENLRMFDLFGFEVGRVTSCRFNTAWTILASQAPRSGQSATRFKPTMVLRFRKPSYHSTSNISHS